ncbi:MAG: hypothetical protein R2873_32500 [Caldilineaceae bacterium]
MLDKQKGYPGATGTLTNILYDIALAAKIISSRTTRAGLVEILGSTGRENVQGEVVQKLDEYADSILYKLNDHTGRIAVMASEEHPDILTIPDHYGDRAIRSALRSAGWIVEHRRQREHRHHLCHLSAQVGIGQRDA